MNQENKKKKHNRVKILLIILTVLLVVLSVGYFYLQSKLNLINRTTPTAVILPEEEYFEADEDTTDDASKDTEVNPDDVVWPVDEDFMKDKDIINILLIGQDRRLGEQRARSDSMMIATINMIRTKQDSFDKGSCFEYIFQNIRFSDDISIVE